MKQMENKYQLLYGDNVIQSRIERVANNILHKHLPHEEIVFIGVLKGGFMLLTDLVKAIKRPQSTYVEFISIKTYDENTNEKLSKDKVEPYFIGNVSKDFFKDKHIYIIEDIIESGESMIKILNYLKNYPALSVRIVTLARRISSTFYVDHNVLDVADEDWLVGFGMDDKGTMRNSTNLYTKIK